MVSESGARSEGLREACRILFGELADAKLREYLESVGLADAEATAGERRRAS